MNSTGIRHAISACQYSNHPRAQMGACIIKGGRVLSVGWNNDQRWNKESNYYDFHAEMDAVFRYNRNKENLAGAKIYVARTLKSGAITMAMPCVKCSKFLVKHGITNVFYTNWNGEICRMRL